MDVLVDDRAFDAAVAADAGWRAVRIRADGSCIVVRPHDDAVPNGGAGFDPGAQADDGRFNVRVGEHAAVSDQSSANGGTIDLGGRQKAGVGEDRRGAFKEVKLRHQTAEIEVGVEEVTDGADVFPVALKVEVKDAFVLDGVRDDVLAEIVERVVETFDEHAERVKQEDPARKEGDGNG